MKYVLYMVALPLLMAAGACQNTAHGATEDAQQAAQSVRTAAAEAHAELADEVADFRTDGRKQLDDIDARTEQLQVRSRNLAGAVRRHARQELRRISSRRQALERRLAQLKATTRTAWNQEEHQIHQQLADFSGTANRTLGRVGREIDHAMG